jgi:amino acid transporter
MQSGLGMGLLLILVTPLVWALPSALMTAELASAMPAEGGYYVWVKRAFGPFAGFLCAWWTWVYSWVDVAIYPVLFASYASSLFQQMGGAGFDDNPWLKWAAGMVVIVPFTWLNIRGTRLVGNTSVLFGIVLLAPFIVMSLMGLPRVLANPEAVINPFLPTGTTASSALGAGLFVVMWNYLGWDSMSTIAGEVENPQRNFPRALAWGVPLVTLSYLLPALVGAAVLRDPAAWEEGAWATVATRIGGPWLAYWVTVIGLISAAGLFSATLLAASRIPFVLAEDRLLPPKLTQLHPRYGTPWVAILVSAAFYTVLSFSSFESLAVVDVVLYSAALLVEFAALLVLRRREPNLPRPFRIPGGWPGVILVAALPAAVVAFGVIGQFNEEGRRAVQLSLIALLSAPAMWLIVGRKHLPAQH